MPVKITDKLDFPGLKSQFSKLNGATVRIQIDDDKKLLIASANEFGAIISIDPVKAKRAKRFLAILAKKHGITLVPNGKDYIEIPERSFFRSTFDDVEIQNKVVETVSFYLHQYLEGRNTAREILTRAGNILRNAIQARIASQLPPSNHPLTEAMKGHNRTLEGTSKNLIKSIKLVVEL